MHLYLLLMRKKFVLFISIIFLFSFDYVSGHHQMYSGPTSLSDAELFSLLNPPYNTMTKLQLRDYFMARTNPDYFPLSNWASQATIDRANNAMNNEIITYAGSNYDFSDGSGGFDWNLIPAGDLGLDAAAYLHRFYHMNNIANSYAHTKVWTPPPNEAYVNEIVFELDEYWNEFFKVTPIYHFPDGTVPELNALLNHFERIRNWIETFEYVGPIHESPTFNENEVVEYLKKLYMSIEYIRSNEVQWPITSNQVITGKATFVYAGIMYPEFEAADQWLQFGQDGLENVILTDIFDDGCHNERTPGYHHVTIGSLMNPYKLAAQNGISFSSAYTQRAKLSLDFLKYLVHPNYNYVPAIGDTSIQEGFSMWFPDGYNLFCDDTFRYVESYGTQGTRPTETSKAFGRCGYYILRSGWGQAGNQQSFKDQRHLVFDAARYAGSHSDRDNLQIILFAYDKLLLADPGEYILGGPDKTWFESTAAHNTILVDNRNYNLRNNIPPPDFEDEVAVDYLFNEGFDFLKGSHNGYAVDNPSCGGSCPIMSTNPVVITRNIFYPKLGENLDYFIVSDVMNANSNHDYRQYWHLTPGSVSFDSNKVTISPNLVIAPADKSEISNSIDNGHWISYTYGTRVNAPIVEYRKNGATESYDTVIFPFKNDQPTILINRLNVYEGANQISSDKASSLEINIDRNEDFKDYYYISHITSLLRDFGDYQTDAELIFVRKDLVGNAKKRIIFNEGSILKENGVDIVRVSGSNIIVDSKISLGSSEVKITGTLNTFRIYAPLANSVTLNGGLLNFIQDGDYITDSVSILCTLNNAVIKKQNGAVYSNGEDVVEGTIVKLEVDPNNCAGKILKFEIHDVDNGVLDPRLLGLTIQTPTIQGDNIVSVDWPVVYREDPNDQIEDGPIPDADNGLEYKFNVSVLNEAIAMESSNWIDVTKLISGGGGPGGPPGGGSAPSTCQNNIFDVGQEQCDPSVPAGNSNGCSSNGVCSVDCNTCYYETQGIVTLITRGECIDDNNGDDYGEYEEISRTINKTNNVQLGSSSVTKECYLTKEVQIPFFDKISLIITIILVSLYYFVRKSFSGQRHS